MGRVPDLVAPRVTVRPTPIVPEPLLRAAKARLATIARDVPRAADLVVPVLATVATIAACPWAELAPMVAALAVPARRVDPAALAAPVEHAVPVALAAPAERAVLVDPAAPVDTAADPAVPIKDHIAVSRPRPIRIVREAVLTVLALRVRDLAVPDVLAYPDSPAFLVSSSRSSPARRPAPTARPRARARPAASARPRSRSKTRSSTRPSRTSTR